MLLVIAEATTKGIFFIFPKLAQPDGAALQQRKIEVIRQNIHGYSISAMCKCLQIVRSTYYYESIGKPDEKDLR